MTSDDTHSRTLELLESNAYFGMKPTQIKLLKQVSYYICGVFFIFIFFALLVAGTLIVLGSIVGESCLLG
jgi:uncharacterized membrane protein YjgN (DUF898 family)